jgi:4-hydroxy-4-methyl-2-oxoglutarate aldolase
MENLMPHELLSPEELEALRCFSTPSISNAIERFDVQPRQLGFTGPELRCMFPDLPPIVGYATTATIAAEQPGAAGRAPNVADYWDFVLSIPAPRIAVIQDLDQPVAIGSFWGEVNGNIHRALGCIGAVTNGGVRDLEEVRALGFQFLASAAIVSHSYVHMVDYGIPVKVGGLWVQPGDLIHADRHGAIVIPHEIAREVAAAAAEVERGERVIIDFCQSPEFDVQRLKELVGAFRAQQASGRR